MNNEKTLAKLRKYARLRFPEKLNSESVILKVYRESTAEDKKIFNKEINAYIKAIKDNRIKPGESYLHTAFSVK